MAEIQVKRFEHEILKLNESEHFCISGFSHSSCFNGQKDGNRIKSSNVSNFETFKSLEMGTN